MTGSTIRLSVLDERALVLNRRWIPIRTTSVRMALCLLFKGAALVIEPATYETYSYSSWAELSADRERFIRTPRSRLRVPEVIVLTRYAGIPRRDVVFSRRNLFRRDRFACQYCGARPGAGELTIDHVIPRALGGRSSWENCVLACVDCNKRKANRTPRQARMRLLKTPVKPKWSPAITIGREFKESWDQFVSRLYWETELKP